MSEIANEREKKTRKNVGINYEHFWLYLVWGQYFVLFTDIYLIHLFIWLISTYGPYAIDTFKQSKRCGREREISQQ